MVKCWYSAVESGMSMLAHNKSFVQGELSTLNGLLDCGELLIGACDGAELTFPISGIL